MVPPQTQRQVLLMAKRKSMPRRSSASGEESAGVGAGANAGGAKAKTTARRKSPTRECEPAARGSAAARESDAGTAQEKGTQRDATRRAAGRTTSPRKNAATPGSGASPEHVATLKQPCAESKPASPLAQARLKGGTIWQREPRRTLYYPFRDAGRTQVVSFPDLAQGLAADMAQAYEGHDTYRLSDDDVELLDRHGLIEDGTLRRGAVRRIETLLLSFGLAPSHVSELSFVQAIGLMRSRSQPASESADLTSAPHRPNAGTLPDAEKDEPDGGLAQDAPATPSDAGKQPKVAAEDLALAHLTGAIRNQRPVPSQADCARAAGVSRQAVNRMPNFRTMWLYAKAGEKASVRRGRRTPAGDVEAEA